MTPKEKAIELVDKFNKPDTTHYPYVHNAQQCALIAVDEIISEGIENGVDDFYSDQGYYINNETYLVLGYSEFWQEVKQEIEAL